MRDQLLDLWATTVTQLGTAGAAIAVVAVAWIVSIAVGAGAVSVRRWWRRRQLRRELQLLRGGRETIFAFHPELADKPSRPAVRSLRHRGTNDAA